MYFFFVSFVRRPLIFCVKCWCVINKCIKMKKPWKIRNEPYPTFSYVLYKEWKKLKTNEILNIYLKHIFPFLFQFCFWCDEIKTFSVNISQLNAEREEGKKTAHERLSHSHLSKCTHSHNIFVRTQIWLRIFSERTKARRLKEFASTLAPHFTT